MLYLGVRTTRGKILLNLALQKPSKRFLEYKQIEYVDSTSKKMVNSNNQTVCHEDNNIESDEEEVNPYSYYSVEESDDNPDVTETLRLVNKIHK